MKKKVLALLLAVVMVVGILPVISFAGNEFTTTVGTVSAEPGESISVPVTITNNPGINGVQLQVAYDDTALEFTGFEGGTLFPGAAMAGEDDGVIGISAFAFMDTTVNGTLITLKFNVLSTCESGTYTLDLDKNADDEHGFSSDSGDLDSVYEDGAVEVETTPVSTFTTTVGTVSAEPGESISVPVTISDNPGINGVQLQVAYDDTALEFTGFECGTIFPGAAMAGEEDGIVGISAFAFMDTTANGTLITLKFNVLSTCPSGTYTLDLDKNADDEHGFSSDSGDLDSVYVDGTVEVEGGSTPLPFPDVATLSDDTVTYDGQAHGLEIEVTSGKSLPDDTNVDYTYDGDDQEPTDAGEYDVVATLTAPGYEQKTLTATLTIDQKTLTVEDLEAEDKVYDGTTTATFTGGTLDGIVGADDVEIDGEITGDFADKNVGTDIAVTVDTISLTGTDAGNYTVTQPTGLTADITAKSIAGATVTIGAEDYTGSPVTPVPTSVTVDGLTLENETDYTLDYSDNTDAGTATATLTGTGNFTGTKDQTFTINKVDYTGEKTAEGSARYGTDGTVDLSSLVAAGGTAAYASATDTDSILNGTPSVTGTTLNYAFVNDSTKAGKTATVTVNVTGATNYNDYQLTVTVTVLSKETATVTIDESKLSFTYDKTAHEATVTWPEVGEGTTTKTVTYDLIVEGEPSGNPSTNAPVQAGSYKVVAKYENDTHVGEDTATLTISPKALTVTGLTATTKEYDGTTAATLSGGALNGVETGDTVNGYFPTVGTFADKDVGTDKAVSCGDVTIDGADADNYTVTQPTGITASITAKALTVTDLEADDKEYDGTTTATFTGGTLDGIVGADDVEIDGEITGDFADKNVGTDIAVTVDTISLTGTDAGNYTLTQPTGLTADITAKELTVTGLTATAKDYDATTAATLTGGMLVGVVTGDTVTGTFPTTGTFASANIGTDIAVSFADVTISGADADNYTVTQPTVTGTINAKDIAGATVVIGAVDYTGEELEPVPTSVTVSGLTLENETDYTLDYSDNTDAGTATATLTGTGNFTGTKDQTFTINKVDYTGEKTAEGSARYGADGTVDLTSQIASGATAEVKDFVDEFNILPDIPYMDGSNLKFTMDEDPLKVGKTATVTVCVVGATNYNDYELTVTVTMINKEDATVTIDPAKLSFTYDKTAHAATVNWPTVGSGTTTKTVTYAKIAEGVPGTPSTDAPTDAGSYKVVAKYENDTHLGSAEATLTIAKANQTIIASDVIMTYGETDKAVYATAETDITYAVTSGSDVVSVDATTGLLTADKAGSAEVTITAEEDGNYNEATKTVDVTVLKATYSGTTTAAGEAKYGNEGKVSLAGLLADGSAYGTPYTYSTLLANDATIDDANNLCFKLSATAPVGQQAVVYVGAAGAKYGDYTVTVTITVLNKLAQTFTDAETEKTVTYDDTTHTVATTTDAPSAVVSYELLTGEDVIELDTANGTYETKATGTATVKVSASETEDYAAAEKTVTITVDKRDVTVQSIDPEAMDSVLTGVLARDAAVSLDFSKLHFTNLDTVAKTVTASNFVLTGDGSENYAVVTEALDNVPIGSAPFVTITVHTTGCTVDYSEFCLKGADITLTAVPDSGFTFSGWTDMEGNTLCATEEYTFLVTDDVELNATAMQNSGGRRISGGQVTDEGLPVEIKLRVNAKYTPYIAGYADGTFKPDQAATRYEVLAALNELFIITNSKKGVSFSDVAEAHAELVEMFAGADVINGYFDGTFKGEKGITRAEFVKIVAIMLGMDVENAPACNLSDVETNWAKDYINAFVAAGYINGYTDGTFKGDKDISRAEVVAILNRIVNAQGGVEAKKYSDVTEKHWAFKDIEKAGK